MADETINIDARINTANSAKSIKELKKALKDLKDAAAGVDETSADFIRLQQAAGSAADRIKGVNESIKGATGEPIERVGGAFKLMGEQLKTLDFKGATSSLNSFSTSLKTLPFGEMKEGAQAFGTAMMEMGVKLLLNPIFLIVGTLAAIGVALWAVAKDARESVDKQIKTYDDLDKHVQTSYDRKVKLMKAQEKDTSKLEIDQKKKALAINSYEIKLLQKLQASWVGLNDDQKKKLDELSEKAKDLQNDVLVGYAEAKAKAEKASEENIKRAQDYKDKSEKIKQEIADSAKKASEEKAKKDKEDWDAAIKAADDASAIEIKIEKEKIDEKLKLDKQVRDAEIESNKQAEADATAMVDAESQRLVDVANLKVLHNVNDLDAQKLYLKAKMNQELEKTGVTEEQKALIKEKYRQEEEKLDTDFQKRKFDNEVQVAEQSAASMQNLSDVVFSIKAANEEKGSKAALDSARKQFKINKALSIQSAVISGIQGVVNALSAKSTIPEPYGTILKAATAVSVGIATAANVAKISATQFSENGGGSAGGASTSIGSAGGSGSGGNFTPASLQQVGGGQSQFNNPNMPTATNSNSQEKQAQKVYVVASDVSTSQNKNATLERRASFNK